MSNEEVKSGQGHDRYKRKTEKKFSSKKGRIAVKDFNKSGSDMMCHGEELWRSSTEISTWKTSLLKESEVIVKHKQN